MPNFKDASDREWSISLDAPKILAVREECDAQFLLGDQAGENNTFNRLAEDPVLLCRVVYVLTGKQRNERSISEPDFYEKVLGEGDAIERATEALSQAILSFTPRHKREFLRVCADKQSKWQEVAVQKALAKVNDPETERQVMAALDQRMVEEVTKALTQLSNATSLPAS